MKKPAIKGMLAVVLAASIALAAVAAIAWAGGGEEETGKLEHVVSLEGKSGAMLLMAKWYNEDRLIYALVVTASMALLGIVVGQVTELVLRMIGIK